MRCPARWRPSVRGSAGRHHPPPAGRALTHLGPGAGGAGGPHPPPAFHLPPRGSGRRFPNRPVTSGSLGCGAGRCRRRQVGPPPGEAAGPEARPPRRAASFRSVATPAGRPRGCTLCSHYLLQSHRFMAKPRRKGVIVMQAAERRVQRPQKKGAWLFELRGKGRRWKSGCGAQWEGPCDPLSALSMCAQDSADPTFLAMLLTSEGISPFPTRGNPRGMTLRWESGTSRDGLFSTLQSIPRKEITFLKFILMTLYLWFLEK